MSEPPCKRCEWTAAELASARAQLEQIAEAARNGAAEVERVTVDAPGGTSENVAAHWFSIIGRKARAVPAARTPEGDTNVAPEWMQARARRAASSARVSADTPEDAAYLPNLDAQEAMYWENRRQGMGLSDKQIGDLLRAAFAGGSEDVGT